MGGGACAGRRAEYDRLFDEARGDSRYHNLAADGGAAQRHDEGADEEMLQIMQMWIGQLEERGRASGTPVITDADLLRIDVWMKCGRDHPTERRAARVFKGQEEFRVELGTRFELSCWRPQAQADVIFRSDRRLLT